LRLKQIKLSGFKSFVDQTAFEVPSQLVGVVGPNGCGKSNIMDAVRWVLGESRATELRGESMQDVIFNGSGTRKQSSRASVELVFDNSLGRIGGAWAQYSELSVKRVLGRDGQSLYLINNQSVRRKDVYDIFLGTGLGPRAYAIIGQGTISRIIEAKPEELRIFLEEAAGVSKYKERRRETENRLSDTRENLTRVDDILRELTTQLEKLGKQADVAQAYREAERDRDIKQRVLWIVRRDEAQADRGRIAAAMAAAQATLEAKIATLRSAELQIEAVREAHYADVTRIEAELRLVLDRREQIDRQLRHSQAANFEARQRREAAQLERGTLADTTAQAQERAEMLAEQLLDLEAQIPEIEVLVRIAQQELETARTAVNQHQQGIELSSARQRSLVSQLDTAEQKLARLKSERAGLARPDSEQVAAVTARLEAAQAKEEQLLAQLEAAEKKWEDADAKRVPAREAMAAAQGKLTGVEARVLSLRQLQERVQGQSRVKPWLAQQGLDGLGKLWQKLDIAPGWETAVEAVLRERVQAIELGQLDRVTAMLDTSVPGKLAFYSLRESSAAKSFFPSDQANGLLPLATHVRSQDAGVTQLINEWLAPFYCADDAKQAMTQRGRLPAGAAWVVKSGHVIGRASMQLYAADSEQEGILARARELDSLERESRALQLLADESRVAVVGLENFASQSLQTVTGLRVQQQQHLRELAQLQVEVERLKQLEDRALAASSRVESELTEQQALVQQLSDEQSENEERFSQLDETLGTAQEAFETTRTHAQDQQTKFNVAQQALRDGERQAQEAGFEVRSLSSRAAQLEETITASLTQAERTEQLGFDLEQQLSGLSDSDEQERLQVVLDVKVQREQELVQAREKLEELTRQLRGADESRVGNEREQEPLRQKVVELQLKVQAAELNAEQFSQMLSENSTDESLVLTQFAASPDGGETPDGIAKPLPKASWLQGEVTRLNNVMTGLGPVNLAALDELKESSERKEFLAAQLADLNEAIQTLEDAIHKIDKETRDLLQGTFDSVNEQFGVLFPQLFGGGDAKLVLTGSEILDSGVQVMAQPPGKKNATIHLLSGGEKALTAIALVFAMFRLNPAPFCLLDEVDAPLDDANTERYCAIVKQMSAQTQFLFITHNKIAMELAQQLIGVTMQEKGVSRIVAVDLDAATRFAEAA
jgi:chromosome segregation protein